MKDDAEKKHRAKPTARELDLIESLRRNPKLMDHIEELAMMTRTPEDLLKDGNQAGKQDHRALPRRRPGQPAGMGGGGQPRRPRPGGGLQGQGPASPQ